jgi:hypothetical protein
MLGARHSSRLAVLASVILITSSPASVAGTGGYRPFSDDSYWNTPLPRRAPRHDASAAILRWIRDDNATNYIHLSGTGSGGRWGMPVYWAKRSSPIYNVRNNCRFAQPPEFDRMRIPRGARPDPTSDSAMTVYDRSRGIMYGLFMARYDKSDDRWSSCGGAVYYTASNGLHGDLAASDEQRNRGHRGLPPSTWAVRYGQIELGAISHVVKIAVDTTRCRHVFPMTGDECGTSARRAPSEGTRIRIRPSVDLGSMDLSPGAMVIARALQRYGAVIGDQSGGSIVLKLENTVASGHGQLWSGVLRARSLSKIPLRLFEVIRHGYRP